MKKPHWGAIKVAKDLIMMSVANTSHAERGSV